MWNWLVSALACGTAIVLFDGSPFKPTPMRLYELVDRLKYAACCRCIFVLFVFFRGFLVAFFPNFSVSVSLVRCFKTIRISYFGASAKYFAALDEAGIKPNASQSLSSLRALYSTGSPLKPESFDYVYAHIKADVLLGSITGGTDIVSLFAGANMALPVHRGEIQCVNLGMKVEAWSEEGKKLIGERGDLVCTRPFPCQPVFFWNDKDGSKYHKAYFANFPGTIRRHV